MSSTPQTAVGAWRVCGVSLLELCIFADMQAAYSFAQVRQGVNADVLARRSSEWVLGKVLGVSSLCALGSDW